MFRFPFRRPEILNLWIKAIRREKWKPSKSSKLCSEHFVPSDFLIRLGSNQKVLKPDADPSIFSFPKHLQKKSVVQRRDLIGKVSQDSNLKHWKGKVLVFPSIALL